MPNWPAKALQNFRDIKEREAMKEIRIQMDDKELQDPQRITELNKRLLAQEFDGDMEAIHKHEVHDVIDDFDKGVRVIQIRKRKFYT